ncbi:hypothetical protein YPPY54_1913, partial [Yersinia pestis PY-54]
MGLASIVSPFYWCARALLTPFRVRRGEQTIL